MNNSSEFDRINHAAGKSGDEKLRLGTTLTAATTETSSPVENTNSLPLEDRLGINQALLILEEEYPQAYERIRRIRSFMRIHENNRFWHRGDGPAQSVSDLLMVAFHDYSDEALRIVRGFLDSSPEDAEIFHPDYVTGPDDIEDENLFPFTVISKEGSDVVREMMRVYGFAPELPGALLLGLGSVALANKLMLKSVGGLDTYPNLYIIGGGRTGVGKSVAAKPFIQILRDFQKHLQSLHRQKLPRLEARLNEVRALISEQESAGEGMEPDASDSAPTVEALLDEERTLMAAINPPRVYVDDVTSEELTRLAGINGGPIASFSPDSRSAIKILMGRYRRGDGTDEDALLKGYSNEPIVQDRISREGVDTIACFVVFWLTQLRNFQRLYSQETLTESGLLCRVLPFTIPYRRRKRQYEETELSPAVMKAFRDRIWELLTTYYQSSETYVVSVTAEARKVLVDYEERTRDRIDEGELAWIEEYAVRLGEHAWRVSLVLHALEHGGKAHIERLTEHTAKGAVKLVSWFFGQTVSLFGSAVDSAGDARLAAAREFVSRHPEGVTPYELKRYKQDLFASAKDARLTLQVLADEGAIKAGDAGSKQRFSPRPRPKS